MSKLKIEAILFLTIVSYYTMVDSFDNTSAHFLSMHEEDLLKGRFLGDLGSRKPRFLNVQKIDDEIVVRVEFGFEFISIPVLRVMHMANGMINAIPTFKFSLGTLVVGLVMLFGVIVTVPALSNLLSVTHANKREESSRNVDSAETAFDEFGDFVYPNSLFMEMCTQRVLCTWVKRVSKRRNPGEFEDFVFSLLNHKWLSKNIMNETKLSRTIQAGINGDNCHAKYAKCKINQKTLSTLSKSLANFFE